MAVFRSVHTAKWAQIVVWSLAQPGTWLTETTSANLDLYVNAGGVRRMVGSPYPGPLYPAGDCR